MPPDADETPTGPRLNRLVAYVHDDEFRAVVDAARRQRVSRGEIVRRALRKYLRIED